MTIYVRQVIASIVRVFADDDGRFGNALGVIVDEARRLDNDDRLLIARHLAHSETVFVNSLADADVTFVGLSAEVGFAGHAAVGAAWYLRSVAGTDVVHGLRTRSGLVGTWHEGGRTWVQHGLEHTPAWWHERLPDARSVDCLGGPQSPAQTRTMVWAWRDEAAGRVRARTFASEFGAREDEANGSGSMQLAAALGRALEIDHGVGSVIHARLVEPGVAAVGGRVVADASREVRW